MCEFQECRVGPVILHKKCRVLCCFKTILVTNILECADSVESKMVKCASKAKIWCGLNVLKIRHCMY